jgi:uncharacterized protein YaaN involved in tellurite resistance
MIKFSNIEEVASKLKELKEAKSVCQKIEDQVSWACDFTRYQTVSNALDPIYEAVDSARDSIDDEINFIEDQLENYKFKLDLFEHDNKIEIEN